MPLATQIPDSSIGHAVDAVFSDPAFNRFSPWQRFMGWLFEMLQRLWSLLDPLFSALHRSATLYWTVIALLALVLGAIVGRALYLWRQRRAFGAGALGWESSSFGRAGRDPWTAAEELSASGDFTSAAHALYAALLESAARHQQLRLHPSKTAGDYVRELRARSSGIFTIFRDFARSYETVIYGIGVCDEERYRRLYALAAPIVRPAHRNA
ncbi:MAG TPA: DUF4129 domain-containing protein [Gemmatimonadaceae bacterium]